MPHGRGLHCLNASFSFVSMFWLCLLNALSSARKRSPSFLFLLTLFFTWSDLSVLMQVKLLCESAECIASTAATLIDL